MALRFLSSSSSSHAQREDEVSRSADEVAVGAYDENVAAAHSAEEGVYDIYGYTLDSPTVTAVQMFLSFAVGAVVLALLRNFGMAADPGRGPVSPQEVDEGYSIGEVWRDARCFVHFVLGVLLCLLLQGKPDESTGRNRNSQGEVVSTDEPRKSGVYMWLLW